MLDKFLKDVIGITVGKQAEEIVSLLNTKKYVNEFIISKKLNLTINQTRNILYKIADYGLVSFERKKDKKKGWYTYFWRIEIAKALDFLKEELVKQRNVIVAQINVREEKQFYECKRCNIESTEDEALMHDFVCPECGDVFTLKDNSKLVKDLQRTLNKIDKELELIDVEIAKEREKTDKVIKKEIEKDVKDKAKARADKRESKLNEAKNAGKLDAKKEVKKKATKKIVKKSPVKKKAVKKNAVKKKAVKKNAVKKKAVKKKPVKKIAVKKVIKKKSNKK